MHNDIQTPRLCLRPMTVEILEACWEEDWERAEAILGFKIPAEWRVKDHLIERRLNECRADPLFVPWSVRAMGLRGTDEMIGHIGFHTRPDPPYLKEFVPRGVELGYSVAGDHRRQGYASEAIRGMLDWASRLHGVDHFVVSVSPANIPSTALAAKLGFERIGGHQDEIDGYEDVFVLTGPALARFLETPAGYNRDDANESTLMLNERLIEAFRADNAPQAHLVRDELEAEGIPARVDGEFLQGALGGVPLGWNSLPRVLVAESDAIAAKKVIEHLLKQADSN